MEKRKQILDIDSILIQIGEFGLYQKLVDAIFCVVTFLLSFQILIMYFVALTPTWTCNNSSIACTSRFNGTQPAEVKERCNLPPNSWKYTEQRDFSVVTQFNICNKEWLLDLLQSIHFFGWGMGAAVLGWVGELLGRKKLLFPSCGVIIACGFITPFIRNIYIILALRFIIGFFLPGAMVQAKLLIAEIVGNKKRPLALMIPIFSYPIGYSILALKSYLLKNWRYLTMACTAPYIFVFLFYSFITESPKWLHARGRTEEAIQSLRKIARWNGTTLDDDIVVLHEVANSSSGSDTGDTESCNSQLIFGMIIQSFLWFVSHMSFFGLQMAAKELQGSMYSNFVFLSLIQTPALLVIILSSSRFGRKKTNLISLVCSGAASLAIVFVPSEFVTIRVILGVSGKFFACIHANALYIWSTELLPTSVRSRAMGVLQFSSRSGAMSSTWVVKGLTPIGGYLPFVVLGVSSFMGGVIGLWLKETKVTYNQERPLLEANIQGRDCENTTAIKYDIEQ